MPSSTRRPLVAILLLCLAAALAPAAASAAPGSGSVTLTVGGKGKAAKALTSGDVRVRALAPAKKRGKRVVVPVQRIAVGKGATVALRGGIAFTAGKRSLKLRSLRVAVGAKRATVSARSGKGRATVLVARLPKGKAKLNRSNVTASLRGAKLGLTARGARLLRAKLAVTGIRAGLLGQLGVDAKGRRGSGGAGGGGGGGGTGPGGGPQAGPIENEPPVLARPDGAVDVTAATLTWRPRESWIQYINGGEGTSVFDGALNGPLETKPGRPTQLVYSFHGFPLASGWYHAATGAAAIYFRGGVGFRWSAHGINFSAAKPEIEINGGASRAIFTFNGSESTKYDNQRGVLVDLHPTPIQTPPGGEVVYADIPASVPADAGASVFAGFYAADAPFGTISVSFTAPAP